MEWSTTPGITVKSLTKTKNPFSVSFQFFRMSPRRGHQTEANKRGHVQYFAFRSGRGCSFPYKAPGVWFPFNLLLAGQKSRRYPSLTIYSASQPERKKNLLKWIVELIKNSFLCWTQFHGPWSSRATTWTASVAPRNKFQLPYLRLMSRCPEARDNLNR